jgi:GT2 family glycosyltransferase
MPSARWEAGQLLLGRFSRGYRPAWDDPAWVSGAALIIASDDFRRIAGFSREIFLYFEDADLCARHREHGGTVAIDRDFVIEHEPGMSSLCDHDLDGVARWSGRIFATRHGGPARAAALYVLLAGYYMPRRVVLTLLRRLVGRDDSVHIQRMVLDLLRPRRVLRRLEVPEARPGWGLHRHR